MSIEVRGVTKTFGSFVAVNDVSLHVQTGELVALVGPSGSGKTSLLRIIAGLERADRGQVLFAGEDATVRDVRKRGVGFVFQHYALPPHVGVRERRLRAAREAALAAPLEPDPLAVGLPKLVSSMAADRYPSQLSGGQRRPPRAGARGRAAGAAARRAFGCSTPRCAGAAALAAAAAR